MSKHSAPPHSGQLTNIEEMKKGESNILVAIRLRPMLEKEITEGRFNLVKILDEKVVVLQDPKDFVEGGKNDLGRNRTREK